MLVLSRKIGETVVLPQQQISVRVLRVRGDCVVLGFSAPADIRIDRQEVWERLQGREMATESRVPEERPA